MYGTYEPLDQENIPSLVSYVARLTVKGIPKLAIIVRNDLAMFHIPSAGTLRLIFSILKDNL